jgi:hypothetical protein
MPIAEALQSRIAELSDELRNQSAALAAAQKEKARLAEVEADLSRIIQGLRSELKTSQQNHSDDLIAASTAADTLRGENDNLRKERDELTTKCAALEKEAKRMSRRAQTCCDAMVEMDSLLSGMTLLTSIVLYICRLLLVLTHVNLGPQMPGLNQRTLPLPPSPSTAPRKLLPGAASLMRPTYGLGVST